MTVTTGDIELAGVYKHFGGVAAVDGVNLKIPDGAYCCFLGPSGCGKTTILRMIAGHEDPTGGEILIGGEDVVGLPPVERRTAMMFQSYALFPHLTVRDNVRVAAQLHTRQSLVSTFLRTPGCRRTEEQTVREAFVRTLDHALDHEVTRHGAIGTESQFGAKPVERRVERGERRGWILGA